MRGVSRIFSVPPCLLFTLSLLFWALHSWPLTATATGTCALQLLTGFSLKGASVEDERVRGECNWGVYSPESSVLGLRSVTFNLLPQVSAFVRQSASTANAPHIWQQLLPTNLRTQGWWRGSPIPVVSLNPTHTFVTSPFIKLSPNYFFSECSCFPAGAKTDRELRSHLKDLGYISHGALILRNSI